MPAAVKNQNTATRSRRSSAGAAEAAPEAPKRSRGRPKKGGAAAAAAPPGPEQLPARWRRRVAATGATGGGANGGAIYGEIGAASFQKVVDLLKERCGLDEDSYFLDVGSGLGKPNLHVAQDPGVAVSVGVEFDETRWQLGMHNLNSVHRAADRGGAHHGVVAPPRVAFARRDVDDCATLDPFSHVYAFDVGFPPELLLSLGRKFNASRCGHYVSYQNPRRFLGDYGFHCELEDQLSVSAVRGSAAVRRSSSPRGSSTPSVDPVFAAAVKEAQSSDKARRDACAEALEAARARPNRDRSPREEWRPGAENEYKGCGYDMSTVLKCGRTDAQFAASTEVERVCGRDAWIALVPEMVAVCFEAAKRALKKSEVLLEPPLSADYITERIVLAPADPVGFVARERHTSKRIQGFALLCEFCTFSKSLRWDSSHPAALAGTFEHADLATRLQERCARRRAAWPPRNSSAADVVAAAEKVALASAASRDLHDVDDDGSLAMALEATGCELRAPADKEYGDQIGVWPGLCEVAVLGALGCGRRLLDLALKDVAALGLGGDAPASGDPRPVTHAVLHATKEAVGFYERCGFRRVGAISRFRDRPDVPQLAYRHWTRRVDEVSYMMAAPLDVDDDGAGAAAPPAPKPASPRSDVARRRAARAHKRLSKRRAIELVHTALYSDVQAPGGATAFRECLLLAPPPRGRGHRPLALAVGAALNVFRADIPDKTIAILRAKALPEADDDDDSDLDGGGDVYDVLSKPGGCYGPGLPVEVALGRAKKRKPVTLRLRAPLAGAVPKAARDRPMLAYLDVPSPKRKKLLKRAAGGS
ncbi:hypothetical protein JL720_4947 [Aureococcus anophagefferens]|nr:hypothetical protein JL720_4947 [Aureococcus anophagefferens]